MLITWQRIRMLAFLIGKSKINTAAIFLAFRPFKLSQSISIRALIMVSFPKMQMRCKEEKLIMEETRHKSHN